MEKKILILTDGKAGHENQSKAFARALGLPADRVEIHFKSPFAKMLSYALDHLGIHTRALFAPSQELEAVRNGSYAVVLGTGSGTFYAAKTLARAGHARCGVVLYPRGYRLATFDCVLAPAFDRPAPAPNVIPIPANLVAADAAFYAAGTAAFRDHYARVTGRPVPEDDSTRRVAVIVGGPNKCATLTAAWMKERLDAIFAAAPANTRLWVTTSRRTPPDVEAVVAAYPWDYRLLYSQDRFNPIPGFVTLADELHVTAESTGMLSEACTSGHATVHALDNLAPGPHKFRRFTEDLASGGYLNGNRKIDLTDVFAHARALLSQNA